MTDEWLCRGVPRGTPLRCSACGDTHQAGIDIMPDDSESGICAWCYFGEFGYWPHGMTQERDDERINELGTT